MHFKNDKCHFFSWRHFSIGSDWFSCLRLLDKTDRQTPLQMKFKFVWKNVIHLNSLTKNMKNILVKWKLSTYAL